MGKGWFSRPKQWMSHRPTLLVVGTVLVGIVFILLLWKIPEWQTPSAIPTFQRAQLLTEYRKTVAQIALVIVVLGTLAVTWWRASLAEKAVEVSREQQITERFTRAIDQLGNEQSMAIRLGGIYALERIAKDSAKDHWQVMEVLTAYVRENARWEGEEDENGVAVSEDTDQRRVPTDIQAILTVLGRRIRNYDQLETLDLSQTDLSNADLSGTPLDGANFRDARLRNVNFTYSHLVSASFRRANLQGAVFIAANLHMAHFREANLRGADFRNANLDRAVFRDANLLRVRLAGAQLERSDFSGANLNRATGLTRQQIDSAITDETTTLPNHLNRE